MNSITEIASRLTSLCNEHKFIEAYTELFADEAVSIDPIYKNEPLKGLPGLIEREKEFMESATVNEIRMSAPLFSGSYFSFVMYLSFTPVGKPARNIEELCVYRVEDGKIISQQFFIG